MLKFPTYKKLWFPPLQNLVQMSTTTTSNTFENDFHKNHIQINNFQRGLLTVGSAFMSIVDPYRADMIACLGETAGTISQKFKELKVKTELKERLLLCT